MEVEVVDTAEAAVVMEAEEVDMEAVDTVEVDMVVVDTVEVDSVAVDTEAD